MLEPGVTGAWSVRDIIAHVTTWDEEALKHLPLVLKGGKPPRYSLTYGGIDAFNALMTEQKKDLSLPEVLRQMNDTHRRVLNLIESAPESQLKGETRFRHRLRLDTYGHSEARSGNKEVAREEGRRLSSGVLSGRMDNIRNARHIGLPATKLS
jgi:hypothetical protein